MFLKFSYFWTNLDIVYLCLPLFTFVQLTHLCTNFVLVLSWTLSTKVLFPLKPPKEVWFFGVTLCVRPSVSMYVNFVICNPSLHNLTLHLHTFHRDVPQLLTQCKQQQTDQLHTLVTNIMYPSKHQWSSVSVSTKYVHLFSEPVPLPRACLGQQN